MDLTPIEIETILKVHAEGVHKTINNLNYGTRNPMSQLKAIRGGILRISMLLDELEKKVRESEQ